MAHFISKSGPRTKEVFAEQCEPGKTYRSVYSKLIFFCSINMENGAKYLVCFFPPCSKDCGKSYLASRSNSVYEEIQIDCKEV